MGLSDVKDLPAEALEEKVMRVLVRDAIYAIRSNNQDCVYECYGEAKMARALGAIKKESFWKLNRALVNGWMNAGPEQREAYAESVTEEDIRAGRNWRDR